MLIESPFTKSLPRSLLLGAIDEALPLEVVTRQLSQLYPVVELEEKRNIFATFNPIYRNRNITIYRIVSSGECDISQSSLN